MLKFVRIGISALALSAVLAAPAIVLSAAPATAQQGNGNGHGNAGGTGQGAQGNGNAFGNGNSSGGTNTGGTADGGFSLGDDSQSSNTGNGNGNGNAGGSGNGTQGNGNAFGRGNGGSGGAGPNLKDAGGGNNGGESDGGFDSPSTSATSSSGVTSTSVGTTALARLLETLFGAPVTTVSVETATAPAITARIQPRRVTRSAPLVDVSIAPPIRPEAYGALHPSNLGSVTGAINASTNAKLGRIASGNLSGPVGLAAALAIADYTMAALQEDLDVAKETLALAAAFDLVKNAPTKTEIANAEALLDNGIDDKILDARARSTLNYPDLGPALRVIEYARARGTDQPGPSALAHAASVVNELVAARTAITRAEENILSAYAGALDASPETAHRVIEAVRLANPSVYQIENAVPAMTDHREVNAPAELTPASSRIMENLNSTFGNS